MSDSFICLFSDNKHLVVLRLNHSGQYIHPLAQEAREPIKFSAIRGHPGNMAILHFNLLNATRAPQDTPILLAGALG